MPRVLAAFTGFWPTVLPLRSPVHDALLVQEPEPGDDLGRVEARPPLLEAPALLNVEHEVAAVEVLHHEEQMRLRRIKTNKINF